MPTIRNSNFAELKVLESTNRPVWQGPDGETPPIQDGLPYFNVRDYYSTIWRTSRFVRLGRLDQQINISRQVTGAEPITFLHVDGQFEDGMGLHDRGTWWGLGGRPRNARDFTVTIRAMNEYGSADARFHMDIDGDADPEVPDISHNLHLNFLTRPHTHIVDLYGGFFRWVGRIVMETGSGWPSNLPDYVRLNTQGQIVFELPSIHDLIDDTLRNYQVSYNIWVRAYNDYNDFERYQVWGSLRWNP